MRQPPVLPLTSSNAEERAFFTKLAALNTFFEATHAGIPAKAFGEHAAAVDDLLDRYFVALTSDMRIE
jgi:hypothetical protein